MLSLILNNYKGKWVQRFICQKDTITIIKFTINIIMRNHYYFVTN